MAKAVFFLDENATYSGPEPYFYDKSEYAWVKVLEDNWHIIRDEFAPIIEGKQEIKLSSINPPYLSNPKAWKNIYFWNFMWQYHRNCRQFPKTYALLRSIPNLTFAEFTVLEPHSRVLPHIGETNTTIRGHLGISIPAGLPVAGIKVGDVEREWENGKVILFSDCHRHTVWNESNQRRFVLVFDITKNDFAHQKYWVSAQSLSALTLKYFDEKFNALKKLPLPFLNLLHRTIAVVWWFYLPLQRNFFGLFYS
jgi:aspartyl/asparaginyl beta-hydroxylase (cupin superfamily)